MMQVIITNEIYVIKRELVLYTLYIHTRMQPDGHCNCLRNNNYRFVGKSPWHRVLYVYKY